MFIKQRLAELVDILARIFSPVLLSCLLWSIRLCGWCAGVRVPRGLTSFIFIMF